MMIETEEQQEHRTILFFLIHKGLIKKDNRNKVQLTEKGEKRIQELADAWTMEDVALILIFFCNQEGIEYDATHGVKK